MMHEHGLMLPADLALLMRVMLRLQSRPRRRWTELRATELSLPYVRRMMAERFDPKRLAHHALRTPGVGTPGPGRFPSRSRRHSNGCVKARSASTSGSRCRGAVDRLAVDGLVASASLLAASQLIARRRARRRGVSIAGLAVGRLGARVGTPATNRPGRRLFVQRARGISELRVRDAAFWTERRTFH